MNRFLLITLVSLITSTLSAQDLATKIPQDAFAVVNIQTGQFFKLINVKDFDRSTIGKALVGLGEKIGASDISSVADYGVDLTSTSYFWTSKTDSVTYFAVGIPLSDVSVFERLFAAEEDIKQQGTVQHFTKTMDGDLVTFAWDNRMLCISTGSPVSNYFENQEVAGRYGITYYDYGDYNDDYDAATTAVDSSGDWEYNDEITLAPPVVEAYPQETAKEPEEITTVAADAAADAAIAVTVDEDMADSLAFDTAPSEIDSTWDGYSDTVVYEGETTPYYDDYYSRNVRIKDSLAAAWTSDYTLSIFRRSIDQSILRNRSYLRSIKKDALMTGWLANLETIYSTLLPDLFGMRGDGKLFSYYGSVYAGLYADGEGFKLSTEMEVSDELAHTFKRIYRPKLNRKFLKYVDSRKAVGFFGMALDSKAYLEELPKLMNDTYGKIFAQYENEISLGSEIVSLLLDEEAIASVAKGDGLFVLNGIAEKEVTYTDYEYDEDYNYKEVEKTKMETIPDFLVMFSSENAELYNRLVNYFQYKMLLTDNGGIYHIEESDVPFDLYLYRRDNIVFLGTSFEEMENIKDNHIQGSISKAHRRLLTKNRIAGLMSAQKLSQNIPEEQLRSLDDYIAFHKLFGDLGDFYFWSKGIKGNLVSGEFVAQTPDGYDNAVQYLFTLIDYAAQQR